MDAPEHRGWFDLKIDPGDMPQTADFETRFRARAQNHLEAWGEVVFWKLYSGGKGRPAKRAGALLDSGVVAADVWSSCADYIANPNLDSFRAFPTELFKQPVVATEPRSPRSSALRSFRWWTRRSRDGRGSTAALTATPRSVVRIDQDIAIAQE